MTNKHTPRKRFGQNFLHDQNIIQRIVRAINPQPGQTIVEIGPGQGALTEPLLASGAQIIALEIDRDLAAGLRQRFQGAENFRLEEADALQCDIRLFANEGPLRVVGNLPYNISTPLLFHLLASKNCIQDMVFMLQKEVVDRLNAACNSKQYGRLSVMMQYHCAVQPLLSVPPGAFRPVPKVQSSVVGLQPVEPPLPAQAPPFFTELVKRAFAMRRKTLRNTLKGLVSPETMQQCGIDPGSRAEQLSVSEFVRLANGSRVCQNSANNSQSGSMQ